MLAGNVHSVIAAGLENPELLARWQQEPDRLRSHGVDPAELDLEALWKFGGLTAKVRHNGLRMFLPLTFRLLNIAGLEIEVFASYAAFVAAEKRHYAETSEGRAQDLLNFLERWLDFERREHALLWDLLRFEMALARLSNSAVQPLADDAPIPLPGQVQPAANSVPRVCGEIILHAMSCDPRLLGAKLTAKSPHLADLPPGGFHFCYWRRPASAEIHILELDEFGFYVLSFTDGTRSAAALGRLLGGKKRPSKAFLNGLGELAVLGVIAFDA